MEKRYEKICALSTNGNDGNHDVSVVSGALLYDTMTQSKLIQLKLQNNGVQTLTGVLVKCVFYGEARENVLGETFYQYEGIHVASGEAFGEQTPIAIQAQNAQAFDVVIVNVSLEEQVFTQEEMPALDAQNLQKTNEALAVSEHSTSQVAVSVNEKSPKKKFSRKWLIVGGILIGALLFAVFGFSAADSEDHNQKNGLEHHTKELGKSEVKVELCGPNDSFEGAWNVRVNGSCILKLAYFEEGTDLSWYERFTGAPYEITISAKFDRARDAYLDAVIVEDPILDATDEEKLERFDYYDREYFKEKVCVMEAMDSNAIRALLSNETFDMRNNYYREDDNESHTITFYADGTMDAKIISDGKVYSMYEAWRIENGKVICTQRGANDENYVVDRVFTPYQFNETTYLLIDEPGDYSMVLKNKK